MKQWVLMIGCKFSMLNCGTSIDVNGQEFLSRGMIAPNSHSIVFSSYYFRDFISQWKCFMLKHVNKQSIVDADI